MKKKEIKEDLLKRYFRRLIYIWEYDRKNRLIESKKITEEERAHVEDFLFWLQGHKCQIQEPDNFVAKTEYFKHCFTTVGKGQKKG